MEKKAWESERRLWIFILIASFFVGAILQRLWLTVAVGQILYVFYLLYQIKKIQSWIYHPENPLPECRGLCGSITDGLHLLQRRAHESRTDLIAVIHRARDSVQALSQGVILVDEHGSLEWWNKAANRLVGLQYPGDLGRKVTQLIRNPKFRKKYKMSAFEDPLIITSPVKYNQVLQFQFTKFGKGDVLIIVSDISRLTQLEKIRTEFVANVSHELKTPLTVLRGYLETLSDHREELPPLWHKAIDRMDEQSKRMSNLVQDLLLLSRLESDVQTTQEQRIDVSQMINALCREARIMLERSPHRLTCTLDQQLGLTGVAVEIQSAFSNLIMNAIFYSAPNTEIQILWQKVGNQAELKVIDQGPGIEEQHITRLTERFYRIDPSRSTATGGTGLGLAIVKHVLLRHKAVLEIKSQMGVGSVFTCRFPAERITELPQTAA